MSSSKAVPMWNKQEAHYASSKRYEHAPEEKQISNFRLPGLNNQSSFGLGADSQQSPFMNDRQQNQNNTRNSYANQQSSGHAEGRAIKLQTSGEFSQVQHTMRGSNAEPELDCGEVNPASPFSGQLKGAGQSHLDSQQGETVPETTDHTHYPPGKFLNKDSMRPKRQRQSKNRQSADTSIQKQEQMNFQMGQTDLQESVGSKLTHKASIKTEHKRQVTQLRSMNGGMYSPPFLHSKTTGTRGNFPKPYELIYDPKRQQIFNEYKEMLSKDQGWMNVQKQTTVLDKGKFNQEFYHFARYTKKRQEEMSKPIHHSTDFGSIGSFSNAPFTPVNQNDLIMVQNGSSSKPSQFNRRKNTRQSMDIADGRQMNLPEIKINDSQGIVSPCITPMKKYNKFVSSRSKLIPDDQIDRYSQPYHSEIWRKQGQEVGSIQKEQISLFNKIRRQAEELPNIRNNFTPEVMGNLSNSDEETMGFSRKPKDIENLSKRILRGIDNSKSPRRKNNVNFLHKNTMPEPRHQRVAQSMCLKEGQASNILNSSKEADSSYDDKFHTLDKDEVNLGSTFSKGTVPKQQEGGKGDTDFGKTVTQFKRALTRTLIAKCYISKKEVRDRLKREYDLQSRQAQKRRLMKMKEAFDSQDLSFTNGLLKKPRKVRDLIDYKRQIKEYRKALQHSRRGNYSQSALNSPMAIEDHHDKAIRSGTLPFRSSSSHRSRGNSREKQLNRHRSLKPKLRNKLEFDPSNSLQNEAIKERPPRKEKPKVIKIGGKKVEEIKDVYTLPKKKKADQPEKQDKQDEVMKQPKAQEEPQWKKNAKLNTKREKPPPIQTADETFPVKRLDSKELDEPFEHKTFRAPVADKDNQGMNPYTQKSQFPPVGGKPKKTKKTRRNDVPAEQLRSISNKSEIKKKKKRSKGAKQSTNVYMDPHWTNNSIQDTLNDINISQASANIRHQAAMEAPAESYQQGILQEGEDALVIENQSLSPKPINIENQMSETEDGRIEIIQSNDSFQQEMFSQEVLDQPASGQQLPSKPTVVHKNALGEATNLQISQEALVQTDSFISQSNMNKTEHRTLQLNPNSKTDRYADQSPAQVPANQDLANVQSNYMVENSQSAGQLPNKQQPAIEAEPSAKVKTQLRIHEPEGEVVVPASQSSAVQELPKPQEEFIQINKEIGTISAPQTSREVPTEPVLPDTTQEVQAKRIPSEEAQVKVPTETQSEDFRDGQGGQIQILKENNSEDKVPPSAASNPKKSAFQKNRTKTIHIPLKDKLKPQNSTSRTSSRVKRSETNATPKGGSSLGPKDKSTSREPKRKISFADKQEKPDKPEKPEKKLKVKEGKRRASRAGMRNKKAMTIEAKASMALQSETHEAKSAASRTKSKQGQHTERASLSKKMVSQEVSECVQTHKQDQSHKIEEEGEPIAATIGSHLPTSGDHQELLQQKSADASERVEIKGILKSSNSVEASNDHNHNAASLQIEREQSIEASKSLGGKKSRKSSERASRKSSRSWKRSKKSSRQASKLESKISHFSKTSEPQISPRVVPGSEDQQVRTGEDPHLVEKPLSVQDTNPRPDTHQEERKKAESLSQASHSRPQVSEGGDVAAKMMRSAPESHANFRHASSQSIENIFASSGSNPNESMASSVIMQLPPEQRAEKERQKEQQSRQKFEKKMDHFMAHADRIEEKKKQAEEERIKEVAKAKLAARMGEIQAKFAALQRNKGPL